MKKVFFLFIIQSLVLKAAFGQEYRLNEDLDKFCRNKRENFKTISAERKTALDEIANQLARKKYVLFTCKTNSRRTLLLQVWAQTAFYYYGLYNKQAFSIGDTVTNVYSGVTNILAESGFSCTYLKKAEPKRFIVSINKDYPIDILTSKDKLGTIDTTKGVVINICNADESSEIASRNGHVNLPYESLNRFENTMNEKQKYRALNTRIAIEMLYLATKTKELILNSENYTD